MIFRLLLGIVASLLMSGSGSAAEKRVALVIGNGAYQSRELPKLDNPTNDADDISKALRNLGFDVISRTNVTRRAMKDAIAEFGRKAVDADASLFYFAGHGVQIRNQNYLMPVDATARSEADIADEGININYALEELDNAKSRVNIVMLDACRDNPVSGKFRSGGGSRGLAAPASMPKGTVIVYATDPGNTAADGEGRNGLFTSGLLAAFKERDLSLDGVLTSASAKVEQLSGGKQTPYVNGPKTVQKSFSFKPGESGQPQTLALAVPKAASAPAAPVADAMTVELSFWESIKNSSDAEDFQEYLRQYPHGRFVGLANNRLKKLVKSTPVPTTSSPAVTDLYNKAKTGDAAALAELKRLADKGDALAQASLGRMYAAGWGVAKDYTEALKWVRKAVDQGNSWAQNTLGVMYEYGRGVAKDEVEAVKWYRKAADQGFDVAQGNLGNAYSNGRGVAKDEAEAVKWYRKAADQGYDKAQLNLGLMYERGRGVPVDEAQAAQWYRKAADQGLGNAQNNLGVLYASGRGVAKDEAEAVRWYQKAADQGLELAQGNLGMMYDTGRGVAKDDAQALAWYRKAAEQGNARAQNNLGQMYEAGRGATRDEAEAVAWYRKAAEQGHEFAEFNLGRMYKDGRGVGKDAAEAAKWFGRAAEKGNKKAQEMLPLVASNSRSAAAPVAAKEPSPAEFCADRPNFISRGICERRECEKPRNAKDPYCDQYLRSNQ